MGGCGVCVHVEVKGQLGSFLSCTLWVPGIEPRSGGLAASPTHSQQAPPTARPWQLILRMARHAAEMQTRQQSLREGQGWGGLWVWMTAKLPRRLSGQVFNLELCWSQAFANNLHLLHLHWCLKPGLWNTVFSMVPLCLRLWFLTHLTQHWWEAPAQGANQ